MYEQHLADRLTDEMLHRLGNRPSRNEARSWERSLPVVAADLVDAGLSGVEMLVEYRMPLSSKRADVVLAGVGAKTGEPTYVVVELKQWSGAEIYDGDPRLVRVDGYSRVVSHPLDQVRDYVDYLADFNGSVDPDAIHGVAYLHNATQRDTHDLRCLLYTSPSPRD